MKNLYLEEILDTEVSSITKGMRGNEGRMNLREISSKGWNILKEDLPLPVAVLKDSALKQNRAYMQEFLNRTGALIAPHGKTTMSPQMFQMQIDDGAWAITAATINQVAIYRHFGISRIFLANQLVGQQNIGYIVDELNRDPEFDFYCLVDSMEGIEMLAAAAEKARLNRPIQVLVEIGVSGYRTGVRGVENALDLARAVCSRSPYLVLRGIEGYEGVFADSTMEQKEQKALDLFEEMKMLTKACDEQSLFADGDIILSAGGSDFYDFAATALLNNEFRRAVKIVIRCGCYITHDDLFYTRAVARIAERSPEFADITPKLTPALEVWGYVQSKPELNLAFANLGKRDISFDFEPPKPIAWMRPGSTLGRKALCDGHRVLRLNDQHAYLELPNTSPLQIGDMVAFGVSHVCTTFDKWQTILLVDDSYNVTGAIRTYF